jgi:hypothetical protein
MTGSETDSMVLSLMIYRFGDSFRRSRVTFCAFLANLD